MDTSPKVETTVPFKVGDWVVNPSTGLLKKKGDEVKLEPKAMEVLVYLAKNQGEVVSREALEANIWTGVIVGYDAVSGSIIKLRKALGDDTRNPTYIKTVSKRGYQLIAPVLTDTFSLNESPDTEALSSDSVTTRNEKTIKQLGSILGFTLIAGLLLYLLTPDNSEQPMGTLASTPSVVVLPFKNLSDDPKQDYLSEGITDDLITDLSRVDSLRVIARQSSYYYKQNPARLEDIASQLQVLYIIEGSVRKLGDQIRINVQLTNTDKGESIWAQRFDTDTASIFKVQDDIIGDVMNAMVVTLSGDTAMSGIKRQTNSFEAYEAFLVGQQYIETRDRQGYEQAMKAFQQALEIDPDYARAYGAMAVTITRGYRYQWTNLSLVEARERALELAEKAVELNQSSPQIYWSLGYVHLHRREYDSAENAARKSVSLSPNYADGYALLANIANWRGNPDIAINSIEKAIALNPHYTFQYPSTLGLAYYNLGKYKEAISVLKEALYRNESALNPRLFLAATYIRLNQKEDAAWEIEQIKTNQPGVNISNLDTFFPFENRKYLDSLIEDLREAGLSEQ